MLADGVQEAWNYRFYSDNEEKVPGNEDPQRLFHLHGNLGQPPGQDGDPAPPAPERRAVQAFVRLKVTRNDHQVPRNVRTPQFAPFRSQIYMRLSENVFYR